MPNVNKNVIAYLYPNAKPLVDYVVKSNPTDSWISFWKTSSLGSQPSVDQLTAVENSNEYKTYILNAYKKTKIEAIASKTATLLYLGFTYGGKNFSLLPSAQGVWLGMYTSRLNLDYPLIIGTVDGTSKRLNNAVDVQNFYTAGIARVRDILEAEADLVDRIIVANNQASVDAVVDTRV